MATRSLVNGARPVRTVQVDVGHSRYPIAIGAGLLGNQALLEQLLPKGDLLIVTDATVAGLYLARLKANFPQRNVAECILPAGEQHKTLAAASTVFDALVAEKLNRDATVVALGGGVVGDIAGFAAACYQRGIGYVQVPTTLLAQVDSSVGGKTGVNHSAGKNLIGAFYQPSAVIADTDVLASLPQRELAAGLAEVIKYGCVCDLLLLDWLDEQLPRLLAREAQSLTHAIARSCEIKAAVVGTDEREHALRAILNFGHTFGHAVEAATGYTAYLHGEAVSLGMLMAADLSQRLGFIDGGVVERIAALLRRCGLPTAAPRVPAARILELMQMDKKVLGGAVRLVLLPKLGQAVVTADFPPQALLATLHAFFP